MFLGEDLLAYLVLAFGAALCVGNFMAVVRPPERQLDEGHLERAPVVDFHQPRHKACRGVIAKIHGEIGDTDFSVLTLRRRGRRYISRQALLCGEPYLSGLALACR